MSSSRPQSTATNVNPFDVATVLDTESAHQADDDQQSTAAAGPSPDVFTPSQQLDPDQDSHLTAVDNLDTVASSQVLPTPTPSLQGTEAPPPLYTPLSGPDAQNTTTPSDMSTSPNVPEPGSQDPALQDTRLSGADFQDALDSPEVTAASDAPTSPDEPEPGVLGADTTTAPPGIPQSSNPPTPRNVHTPLPTAFDDTLEPPRASYLLGSDLGTPRDSYVPQSGHGSSADNSTHNLAGEKRTDSDVEEASAPEKRKSIFKRPAFLIAALAALIVIIVAVVIPLYFTVIKKHASNASASGGNSPTPTSGGGGGSPTKPGSPQATTGGDGSIVTMEGGGTFTYKNPFGGFWVSDPNDPFNNNAQANSWTPPLNTSWTWGTDKAYGVNLGGLFALEPFITPALYQKYPGAVDEWTLSTLMAADTANGGLGQLETHYKTFITEEDIAQIAGAGLNWIRLPIPFWAIEVWEGEPFLAKVCWPYILKVLGWARKYGLRVNLDLHTIPGSQNGYNHSGKAGMINFLTGVMGIANAQRTLGYIRIITEFISQPEYLPVVPIFGIINEPLPQVIGDTQLDSFYFEAYNMIRGITGIGAGNGPYISIHDGFSGVTPWAGMFTGADRMILDTHRYFAFDGNVNTAPISDGTGASAGGTWPPQACSWGGPMNTSQTAFGVSVGGEWSNAFNDCGLFVNGVNGVPTYPDSCDPWDDASTWDAPTKAGVKALALATMDALQNWFFWTWKIGNSTAGTVQAPFWSYQLGLEGGWMPTDPREHIGFCASVDVTGPQFDGDYLPWQTGGAGAGTMPASVTAAYGQWPPAALNGIGVASDVALLPVYTSTGNIVTLPPPTFTATATHSISAGDGWFDAADNGDGVTVIQGCTYPNAWSASGIPIPSACGGAQAVVAAAVITSAPPQTNRR